ncbi:MAG: pantoate--beta-alanine ligase, partial [Ilumatobacteraceae bacterium]
KHFDDGQTESATLCDSVVQALTDNDLVIHYVEIVDSTDLAPVGTAQVGNVVIVAASSGGVRLLDNHILT